MITGQLTRPTNGSRPTPDRVLDLPRDLGDGLVLRFATAADIDAVAALNERVFGDGQPLPAVAANTRDLMSPDHPTCGAGNFTLVEDTRSGQPVSTLCLIPQTWTYAGIPFEVGRPELVATDVAYRRRGLVREQMAVIHARSAALGHLVQGITGISWYYRQFGYEYAMDLGGGRLVDLGSVPGLGDGQTEAYRLRPMTEDDIPFAAPLYVRDCERSLVACPRPDWFWQMLLSGYSLESWERRPYHIIEDAESRPVGYIGPSRDCWAGLVPLVEFSVVQGQSMRAVLPGVLRWLKGFAEQMTREQARPMRSLYFNFGRTNHPAYAAMPELLNRVRDPYAWYIRVPDLPAFLRHIAPVLEARLANSAVAGLTGTLSISEHVGGLRLVFDQGKVTTVEPWQPVHDQESAHFPPGVILQLIFGRSAIAELHRFYPDVWVDDEAAVVLDALFPSQPSCVIALG